MNLIEKIYQQVDSNNIKKERSMRHYPSSASALVGDKFYGKCRRAVWYDMKQMEPTDPISTVSLIKMDIGNLIHQYFADVTSQILGGGTDEQPFIWQDPSLKYPWSGRFDKIFGDEVKFAMEWKSTYGRGITDIKNNGPKDDHLLQCLVYLEQNIYPIDFVNLVYIARDSGFLHGFTVWKGYNVVEVIGSKSSYVMNFNYSNIVTSMKTIEDSLDGSCPPRDYSGDKYPCTYCSHFKRCKSELSNS